MMPLCYKRDELKRTSPEVVMAIGGGDLVSFFLERERGGALVFGARG